MDIILIPALKVLITLLSIYINIIIIAVIFEWLRIFNVINPYNKFVSIIGNFLFNATNPIYRRIRRIIPQMGTIDLSPLILILIIYFIQEVIIQILFKLST